MASVAQTLKKFRFGPAAPKLAAVAVPAPVAARVQDTFSDAQVRDEPILLPDDDLLGMDFYARRLCDYILKIEPPFNIGIYGEWGAGKTSLVELLRYHLNQSSPTDLRFISFKAWQYKSADELWRALIIRIANNLYDRKDDDSTKAPPMIALRERVRRFLNGSPLGSANDDRPVDPYDELLKSLDATLYGGIGRGNQAQIQLNDQEMLVAALKTATTALESVSPFVGLARKLFGLDGKIDFVSMLHQQKNEATRDRIESIRKFQKVIKDLFAAKADKKRVCVFVDDLDRVMPDIALDLMEAMKSLFDGIKCTFIVAADQQLIGQGLKARFHHLLEDNETKEAARFYEKKGREYFEKIIQLGIRVPEPSTEQAYCFISAQFPLWAGCTDLIVAAVGTNPRRLKQYCVLADYRFSVWKRQQQQEKS